MLKFNKTNLVLVLVGIALSVVIFRLLGLEVNRYLIKGPSPEKINTEIKNPDKTQIPPVRIGFGENERELIVSAAVIDNGEWQLFDDKVSWLAESAIPGNGNSIMYAHNRAGLFADLKYLKVGDKVWVKMADGKEVDYIVRESKTVDPDDVAQVLGSDNRLVLYSCEGWFDQKRRVVIADLI